MISILYMYLAPVIRARFIILGNEKWNLNFTSGNCEFHLRVFPVVSYSPRYLWRHLDFIERGVRMKLVSNETSSLVNWKDPLYKSLGHFQFVPRLIFITKLWPVSIFWGERAAVCRLRGYSCVLLRYWSFWGGLGRCCVALYHGPVLGSGVQYNVITANKNEITTPKQAYSATGPSPRATSNGQWK